jgi:hypothetical protein
MVDESKREKSLHLPTNSGVPPCRHGEQILSVVLSPNNVRVDTMSL